MKHTLHTARGRAPVLAALLLCLLLAACGAADTAEESAIEQQATEESTAAETAADTAAADTADTPDTVEENATEKTATEETAAAETAADTATADTADTADATDTAGSSAAQTSSSETGITLEQAQAMALEQAGLTEDAVTITKAKLDQEDGQQVYDIEFRTADAEYDVEISAATGELLSYDYEATTVATGTAITANEAEALALAQVPGATENDIREFKSDYEDGRQVYEGSIVYGGMEYEFEIDASTGTLRSWEAEKLS